MLLAPGPNHYMEIITIHRFRDKIILSRLLSDRTDGSFDVSRRNFLFIVPYMHFLQLSTHYILEKYFGILFDILGNL